MAQKDNKLKSESREESFPKWDIVNGCIQRKNYLLRPWEAQDAVSLAEYANNMKIWKNVRDTFPHPYTLEDAREFIEFNGGLPYLQNFAIVVDGCAVGGLGFIPQSDVERFSAEIGYWIGEPFWNKGIITDAVSMLVNYIFANTDMIRLYASVYGYNTSSMRVLEKNKFRKVGIRLKAACKEGRMLDLHCYELLKPVISFSGRDN